MQPSGTQIDVADVAARTTSVIAACEHLEGPLLPILHGVQQEFGFVPTESLPVIAEALNISNAEVHGVATFYHDYRRAPAGRHVLKLCQAEACQSMGSERIAAMVSQALGIGLRGLGSAGIAYPSVRCPGGECAGLFYPDGASHPVQGRHLDYHWNGERVDLYRDRSAGEVYRIV